MVKQTDLEKKVRQYEVLRQQGRHDESLNLARSLVLSHKKSALAFNTLGHALVHNQRFQNLPEALEVYSQAKSLAPNCIDTLKRYCVLLAQLGKPDEAAEELKKALSISNPDDPLKNQPAVHVEYKGLVTQSDRMGALSSSLGLANLHICRLQIKDIILVEPAAVRLRKAKDLVNAQSQLVCAHHMLAYANLMFAHQIKGDITKVALERTCDTAKKATEKFRKSLVMCLFLAKVLCLLRRYHDATLECLRGLQIENPSDPKYEDITGKDNDVINQSSYNSRIKFMRWQLEMLLNHITGVCKVYWASAARMKRTSNLVVAVDSLYDYYGGTDPLVARIIQDAIRFYKENDSWTFWVCPVLKCNGKRFLETSLLWSHLCDKHKDKINLRSLKLKDEHSASLGYDQIHLCLRQVCNSDVLYLTASRDMFSSFLLLPSSSFKELQQKKCENASSMLKNVKDMMKALPDASCNEFTEAKLKVEKSCIGLFKDCFIDYLEYILPFVRMYQLNEIMKWMAQDKSIYGRSITPLEIELMFLGVPGSPDPPDPSIPVQNIFKPYDIKNIVNGDDMQSTFLDYLANKETEDEAREVSISDAVSTPCGEKFVPEAGPMSIAPVNWDPLPLVLKSEEFEIENEMKLVMYDEKVPVKGRTDNPPFYYAVMIGEHSSTSRTNCVVGQRKPLLEIKFSFDLLSSCEHPNILRPIGVWDWEDQSSGSIIFPHLSGTLSDVPKSHLFTEEGGDFTEFTDAGYQAMSAIFSAVHYINTHYSCGATGTSPLPLLPLRLSLDRIFHIKRAPKEYHILLGDTESRPEHTLNVNVEDVVKINWNALGKSLEILFTGCNVDDELRHLLEFLKEPTVNYEDLSWETALWDISTRMHFVREVFWCLEMDPSKINELEAKPSLGLQRAVNSLGYSWTETNLYHDFTFLRNKILARQDDPYHLYTGPKENIGMEKATIERLFRKEAPKYMLGLVKEVRELNWIKESPLLRSKTEYMNWFQSAMEDTPLILSHAAAPGPCGLALSLLPPQLPNFSTSDN